MLQSKKIIALLILVIFITPFTTFMSCEKGRITSEEYQIQYYREAQLTNIYTNEIAPLSSRFVTETNALKTIIETFGETPNLDNLEASKTQWHTMLKVWKQLELYNIGDVSDSYIHSQINRWHTNENFINGFINGSETINEVFIESKGSSSKGISAIEYILFDNDSAITLSSLSTAPNAPRRLDYLIALSQNLHSKSQQIENLWMGYEDTFVSQLQNGTDGSQNQVINAMITLIEEIIISKLGNALGDNSGGAINTSELEADRSQASLQIIEQHLIALKRSYSGDFASTPFRIGFDDYITELGYMTLAEDIETQFKNCDKAIQNINGSLKDELTSNPENVKNLQDAFTDLLVLIKVDMSNAIGSTITFNDNDGD